MPGPTTAQNAASCLQARVKASGRQFAACKARREDGFIVVWAARPSDHGAAGWRGFPRPARIVRNEALERSSAGSRIALRNDNGGEPS
jgi:hypothetical protein